MFKKIINYLKYIDKINGGENMNIELELNGLNCSNCAEKIEKMSRDISGVRESNFNFTTKKLRVNIDEAYNYEAIREEIGLIVNKLEPDVEIIDLTPNTGESKNYVELELNGLNCSDCASKIERMSREIPGVKDLDFNFVSKKLSASLDSSVDSDLVTGEITRLVNKLEPEVEVVDLRNKSKLKKLDLKLEGLTCRECAGNIEKFTKSLKGVEDAHIDFLNSILKLDYRSDVDVFNLREEIEDIVNTLEPEVVVKDLEKASEKEIAKSWTDKLDKKQLVSIFLAGVLAFLPRLLGLEGNSRFIVFLLAYLIIGHKIIRQAVINIKAGIPFDENFLMTIATLGAFIIGEYPEAVMVMLLYQVGETLQGIAVNHSRDSISSLMDIRPDYANLERNGRELVVDPNDVKIGDIIIIKPGEKVPLDGLVVEGSSSLDTSNITGEAVPRNIEVGDEVVSGVVNLHGLLKVKVSREFGESTISKILDLVENASSKKAETENFITRFSRYYTPFVVVVALGLGIIPPLLKIGSFGQWLYRASVFLVISCPCALVISVPLGFFGGLGGASKSGILIKGGNYLEALADIETIVFDKTGTVTEGVFVVTEVEAFSISEAELLEVAAYGERYSNHPIGKSIISKYGKNIDETRISDYKEIPGKGISVNIDGEDYLLGNKSLMDSRSIKIKEINSIGTVVYIGQGDKHIGTVVVSDKIKDSAREDLRALKNVGIEKTVMLSGDNEKTVEKVAGLLELDEAYGNLLPQDKVAVFEKILKDKSKSGKVAFVGDGVNDAPVLARADVGIAMGGLGSDAAIEASDVVIMTDDLAKIAKGVKIGRNTRKIVTENIVLALGVKLVVLVLGAMGHASMWQAVFADVGVSIIAILNSIRALNIE